MSINGSNLARNEQTDRQKYVYENNLALRGLSAPTPGQFTCIYHNILRSSSLKLLGQLKSNLIGSGSFSGFEFLSHFSRPFMTTSINPKIIKL